MTNSTEYDLASAVLMFNWIEYSVFGCMLFLSLMIGVYYGYFKKQDTVAEYMMGGKKMGVFPVTLSLIFSHTSGITLLGIPAEVYVYGTQYIAIVFSYWIIYYIVHTFYLPVFFDLQLNSLYEYLELRFDRKVRSLTSLIFAVSLIIYIPVVIYVPALAFNQVTGVSVYVITPIVGLICIFYTSFGGLKAVVWTDALQSVFTLGSMVVICILGLVKIGSFSEVWRINDEGHRIELFNMEPSPFARNTFWTVMIGQCCFWIAQFGVHPGAIQRFIAVPTFKHANRVWIWSLVGMVILKSVVVCVGMLIYATYAGCDPMATKRVKKAGQLLPYYVMDVAKDFPGLTGLFISGVVSAALSTMSAGLNTVSGTLYEDFVNYILKGKKQTEAQQSFTIKMIVLVIGTTCVMCVFLCEKLGALFQMAVSLIGVTNGGLAGIFTLGLLVPRANAKGAISGLVSSFVGMCVIVFGTQYYIANKALRFPGKITSIAECPANFTNSLGFNASALVGTYTGEGSPVDSDDSVPTLFSLSYMYYCVVGALLVLVVGVPVSYLTEEPDSRNLDPRLFAPPIRRWLPQADKTAEYVPVNTVTSKEEDTQDVKEDETRGA